MVFHRKIDSKKRAYINYLRLVASMSYRKIAGICGISPSSVVRICREGFEVKPKQKRSGRPAIMSHRERDRFLRKFRSMREDNPNLTVMEIAKECEMSHVSYRTLVRTLNNAGYRCLRPRRKGILSAKDKKIRVLYARNALKKHEKSFWVEDVLMYLDGASFVHKTNPYQDALTPRGRIWRKSSEGLTFTTKGSKDLPGGRRLHLLVGVTHGLGVTVAEEYTKMDGSYFARFVQTTMERSLVDIGMQKGKEHLIFVMDNDPSQNSRVAKRALEDIGAELQAIPARSPDLNPIENVFHNVRSILRQQALEERIERESFAAFKNRILGVLADFDTNIINRTIETMNDRLKLIIENGGCRTKY